MNTIKCLIYDSSETVGGDKMELQDKLKSAILKLDLKYLIVGFIILGFLTVFSEKKEPQNSIDPTSVDTLIPEGMTLVPIEIQNIDALKNIISDFGVVDLYLPSFESNSQPRKVASAIKLMRAPLNPDVFAVLVSEEGATRIAQHPGAFFVTVLNPKTTEGSTIQPKIKQKTRIITEIDL